MRASDWYRRRGVAPPPSTRRSSSWYTPNAFVQWPFARSWRSSHVNERDRNASGSGPAFGHDVHVQDHELEELEALDRARDEAADSVGADELERRARDGVDRGSSRRAGRASPRSDHARRVTASAYAACNRQIAT